MPKTRALAAGTIATALAVASLFAAAPASAAPLPGGQKITVVNSYDGQYFNANNDTAALTSVGAANQALLEEDNVELQGIDVDDNGLGYAVGTSYPEGPDGAYLYAADANTGTLTEIAPIRILFPPDSFLYPDECTSIDYHKGVVTIGCNDDGRFDAAYIGVWDFDGGYMIDVIELTGDPAIDEDDEQFPSEPDNGFDAVYLQAIATDPIGGQLFVFGGASIYENDGPPSFINGMWTASQDAGLTLVDTTGEYEIWGADFDRGGQLWATAYRTEPPSLIPSDYAGLATVNTTTGDLPFGEPWADQEYDIQAITVWGGLPATGPADNTAPLVAAALLLLAGTILAGVTVLRRRGEAQV